MVNMTVSLKTIAKRAGLSIRAVSCALGGKPEVSESTRQRVVALAKELGYRPNVAARAVRSGRFGNIGLLLSANSVRSSLPPEVLSGIYLAAAERGFRVMIAHLPESQLVDGETLPQFLRESCCDGMIVDYTDNIPPQMVDLIEHSGQPAIWINNKRDHDCVYVDDFGMAKQASEALIELGHTRIAYLDLGTPWPELAQAHYSKLDRQLGYEAAMRASGLAPDVWRLTARRGRCDHSEQYIDAFPFASAFDSPDRPTALLTYGHVHDIVLIHLSRRSIAFPRDISLMTFGAGGTGLFGRRLACVVVPERELGAAAVDQLFRKIEHPLQALPPRMVTTSTMVVEGTCGPPRRSEPSL
jgi:LacI family repressor for deo operon, udp, cdd, tsx, nupC, and nupG